MNLINEMIPLEEGWLDPVYSLPKYFVHGGKCGRQKYNIEKWFIALKYV